MAFGDLSNTQQLRVLLELLGGPQYAAQMRAAGLSTVGLSRATNAAALSSAALTRRTFLQNQVMFTSRRLLFYATLGMIGLGAAVIRLGFNFLNTMQQASVAFKGFLPGPRAVNTELRKLYVLAAITPFEFPDIVIATRRLLPFVKNLGLTNNLVKSITDSLSAVGVVTPAALTRASLALAHMFAIGRVTGQVLYQLGRDNIPLQLALEKRFHATGLEIRQRVAGGLITATEAAKALNDYIRTTPGFINAAARQSRTMAGAWATFRDLLRFASGSSQQGLFSGLTRILNSINDALLPLVRGGRPITLYQLARAIDETLTPSTHLLINTFVFLQNVLAGILWQFKAIGWVVSGLLTPFNILTGGAHSQQFIMKLLGRAVSVLIVLWAIEKARLVAVALWTEINTIRGYGFLKVTKLIIFWEKLRVLWNYRTISSLKALAFAEVTTSINGGLATKSAFKYNGALARLTRTAWGAVAAFTGLDFAMLGPIGIAALIIVGLALLYFKVKAVRDIVNDAAKFISRFWVYIGMGFGPVYYPVGLAIKYFHTLYDIMIKVGHLARTIWHGFTAPFRAIGGFLGFQHGGYVPQTRFAMVGERGPEAVVLPGGSHVIPNHAMGSLAGLGGGGGILNIRVMPQAIYLDSKKIGEAIATVVTDREARQ